MKTKRLILSVLLMLILVINTTQITYATNNSTTETTSDSNNDNKENTENSQSETKDSNSNESSDTVSNPSSEGNSNSKASVNNNENWPEAPEITAGSAILIDADTCTILYEKDAHIKAYPASVTKLMTALLTVENCSLSETVTFSHDAAHSITWEDSQIPIVEGEQYTVEQALYALLLKSANEVAYGLAEHVAGTVPDFAQMMTERAAELGALNTHFNNASGLNDPEHYTTAYDIAMFSRACMNNATIAEIMKTRQYVIPPSNKYGYERTINQSHKMLVKGEFFYEYAVGGKTGFTDESKYTLCTFATKDDMNLIAVVLLCEEPEYRFTDTTALFEYGFNNFEKLTLNSSDTSSLLGDTSYYNSRVFGSSNVTLSLASSSVTVPVGTTHEDINMVITRDSTSEDTFANVQFKYGDVLVGNSQLLVSTTTNANASAKPSNLPFLTAQESEKLEIREYVIINAMHVIYGFIAFMFLSIILLGLLFMNYSEYGKELMKTRKRRRGYRRRKLKF